MLSEEFLYQLRQNNPIENVMSSYTHLIKRGRNYVCLCPFHSEKTPSCTVYPDTNSFFCFGCGAGGDAITFIRKIENLEYIEAVKLLAERCGMSLPDDVQNDQTGKIKARILEINRTAARYFYSQLKTPDGEKGRRYIAERKLLPETVKKYGIGYAPDNWNFLNFMRDNGYHDDELVAASLCAVSTKSGKAYGVFRDRLIFPIIDLRGNVIAFGGRIIDGSGPKYLNSSDTPVFKKSRNLFSLNFAKNAKDKRLILAEGYMDVISINQGGFENVVATLGTALTPEQSRLMAHYADEVIIAYDSDGPGQAATHKAINLLGEAGINTKIIKMQGAKDPDEYIKKFGSTRFKLLLDNSDGAISFELNKCGLGLDMDTDVGKVEYLKRAVKVLADITSPIERDVYISKIANDRNVSKEVIVSQVNSTIKKKLYTDKKVEWTKISSFSSKVDPVNPDAALHPKEVKAEKGIIAYLFSNQDKAEQIESKLSPDKFITEFNRKVYRILLNRIKNSLDFNISAISDEFSVDEMGRISEIIAKSRNISITETEINDFINVLLNYSDTKKSEELSDDEFLQLQQKLRKTKH